MTWGITSLGFVMPTMPELIAEYEALYRAAFGVGINLRSDEFLGQVIRIHAGREMDIYQKMLADYNASYPETANGIDLDNVSSINAITRLPATYSTVTGMAIGDLGVVVDAGFIVSVAGNPSAKFKSKSTAIIGAGTNEIQLIDFSAVPDAGAWKLIYSGQTTASLAWNAADSDVETALNNLTGLAVTVLGDTTTGFTVTFVSGSGAMPQPLLISSDNTLTHTGTAVNIVITEDTPGLYPHVSIPMQATVAGPIYAYANTLNVVETPGVVTSFNNPYDAVVGNAVETDSAFRLRRKASLAAGGSTTISAIRTKLLQVLNVIVALVYENHTDVTVGSLPPHSIEAVVLGGTDLNVATAIMEEKPAGIQTYGTTTQNVVDDEGFTETIKFSRPTPIDIYLTLTLGVGSDYPVGPAKTGTLAIGTGTKTITGTSTLFLSEFSPSDVFKIDDNSNSEYMVVDVIASDLSMTVVDNAVNTYTAASAYAAVGDTSIKDNILTFASANFTIGDDILPDLLYAPVTSVSGVHTLEIDAGTAPSPSGDAPIPIAEDEVGVFDSMRIIIVHV